MIRRLYVHNFKCLQNFELKLAGKSSVLLIGKNGSGKSSVGAALEILRKIAQGVTSADALVRKQDFGWRRLSEPMRLEIETSLDGKEYRYSAAFRFDEPTAHAQVLDEGLIADGTVVYTRDPAVVYPSPRDKDAFAVDRGLVALPIFQEQPGSPLHIFKQWLRRMLILRPIPNLIRGESRKQTVEPEPALTDFGAWFAGVLAEAPGAYAKIDAYLKTVMPDLKDVQNPAVGRDARSLEVQFSTSGNGLIIPFEDLSDGEKCFLICALVLASNETYGPIVCFWDEPDNYLAINEVGDFLMDLRRGFQKGGQFIATSHNPEAIRQFSDENTFYFSRRDHLDPTQVRLVGELQVNGDLIGALTRDDVEP